MSDMAMKYEDWLRGCVHHDGRKGNVYLPCDMVLAIADWIEAHRDVAQVRYGRWEECGKTWWCSECGFETGLRWDYCPDCGAKMDGGDDDEKDRYEDAMRYREQLIRMVKAMGQEVINRAYDLVGNSGGITNLEIILTFEQNEFPELTVKRSHASEECVRVMMKEVD